MDVTANPLPELGGTALLRSVLEVLDVTPSLSKSTGKITDQYRMTEHNMMKLMEEDCHLKCKQYLSSLFGESTAEYFLSPSSCSKEIPSWFSQLKDNMKDHTSAVFLWDAMRQRSTQILQESNTEPSMVITNEIVRRVTDWKTLKKQDHLMHLLEVKYMFHCAQRNQAISALLLQQNPLFDYGIKNGLN